VSSSSELGGFEAPRFVGVLWRGTKFRRVSAVGSGLAQVADGTDSQGDQSFEVGEVGEP